MNLVKTILTGLLIATVLWAIGAFCVVVGVDMTMTGRAAAGDSYRYSGDSTGSVRSDNTRLYGPGMAILGLSAVAAGALVIPSGVLHEQGRPAPWWPRVVLGWRIVQVGVVIGLGCIAIAVVFSQFL